MVSRLIKGTVVVTVAATISTFAAAQYGSGSDFSAAPVAAQSYGSGSSFNTAPIAAPTYSAPTYNAAPSYSTTTNTFAGVASPAYADAKYGTGSISNSYAGADVEIFEFSGTPSTVPGLGHNESLRATDCPTNVYNPEGGRVLGCYNVVKPVAAPAPIAQTTYYRVVRPVIYVRYPVACCAPRPVYRPAPAPVCNTKVQPAWTSRYGANGFGAPKANGCGW